MAINGLRARRPPKWLIRLAGAFCRSPRELRALLREDLAFQRAILDGSHPQWVLDNWRVTDRALKPQRMSWALTALVVRHARIGTFLVMLALFLMPGWLLAATYRRLSSKGKTR